MSDKRIPETMTARPGDPPMERAPLPPLSAQDQVSLEGPVATEASQLAHGRNHQPIQSGQLRVGTCQFAVSKDLRRNGRRILELTRAAADAGARVVHFPEAALSGYLGLDHADESTLDWGLLADLSRQVCEAAADLGVWVLLGSAHRVEAPNKPHNSVFVIDDKGQLVDRYDKRFCTTNDLEHYSPGDHRVCFEVDGVRCGVAICFDIRFPELYREYKSVDVHCVFQSNYDARGKGRSHFRHIMRQTMQTRCATNYIWMSATNSSAHYQSYASVFVQPDGRIASRLRDHRPGFMINTVDTTADLYDAAGPHRLRALQGAVGNGPPRFDRRSLDRQRW